MMIDNPLSIAESVRPLGLDATLSQYCVFLSTLTAGQHTPMPGTRRSERVH